jgi:hypothetical protein
MSKSLPSLTEAVTFDTVDQTIISKAGNPRRITAPNFKLATTGAYFLPDYYLPADGTVSGHPDYLPAFNRIQDLISDALGGIIQVPAGDFWLSATFNLYKKLTIRGTNSGFQPSTASTRLIWPKNMTGIRSWSGGVEVGYAGPVNSSSAFAYIEDIGIFCLDGSTISGHGIHMGSPLRLNRVNIQAWGGNGVNIVAYNAAQGLMLGNNANQWYISDCVIRSNKGNGLYVEGADANAGVAIMVSGGNNGEWDFVDVSYLGNTYIGCQSDSNGGSFKGGGSSVYVGCYSESKASAFGAGSFQIGGIGGTDYNSPSLRITGDGTGAAAAVINVDVNGAVTEILPIYEGTGYTTATVVVETEGDGSGLAVTANIVGGKVTSYTINTAGVAYVGKVGGAGQLRAQGSHGGLLSEGTFAVKNFAQGSVRYLDVNLCANANQLVTGHSWNGTANDYEEFKFLSWDNGSRSWQSSIAAVGVRYVGSYTATETGGRSGVLSSGSVEFPGGFWLGYGANGRQVTNGSAAPATGEWARGDQVWNTAPSAGGTPGWVCTTGGTPGTWKAMANLAA